MELQDNIQKQLDVIAESFKFAERFGKDGFPKDEFKKYRRRVKRIKAALSENCSAAAFGESQVGKSYLMSALLSSPEKPFLIKSGSKQYSFIDDLNPSGGKNSKEEATGVITRFTTINKNERMKDYVRIKNLTVVDIILLIADSYYNDVRIESASMTYDDINHELNNLAYLWSSKAQKQSFIEEDDVYEIQDYFEKVLTSANMVNQSNFFKNVAPIIEFIEPENWVNIFELLWNKNEEMSKLFKALVYEYSKIEFAPEIYVPFDTVTNDHGSILSVKWLDSVCGEAEYPEKFALTTNIFSPTGEILATDFSKAYLSAITAELTFIVAEEYAREREFLKKIDLLDFPGARSRERIPESTLAAQLPTIMRRGKVAYLFNKYSRSLQVSSLLFCSHNDQTEVKTQGEMLNDWIMSYVGRTPAERAKYLQKFEGGTSPLFVVATKFNMDLECPKNMTRANRNDLMAHWVRFDSTLPEVIKTNSYLWFDQWSAEQGTLGSNSFHNIYPLRDFYWSKNRGLFSGYSDEKQSFSPETARINPPGYPEYWADLEDSFLKNSFVKKHFTNPEEAWNAVANVCHDGSELIIRDLNRVSVSIDAARTEKYLGELKDIKERILKKLEVYVAAENDEEKNRKVKLLSGNIRRGLHLSVAQRPEVFGTIIDTLMVHPSDLRKIAYDIIILHTDVPKDYTPVNFIKATVGINPNDSREESIKKLCNYFSSKIEDIEADFQNRGFSVDDVISNESEALTTVGDVVVKHIIDFWKSHLTESAEEISNNLPNADEVIHMLITIFNLLKVRQKLCEKVKRYNQIFNEDDATNAIADLAALELNNFVSSVGRNFMNDDQLDSVANKARLCDISIDLSPVGADINRKTIPVTDALNALDESTEIMRLGIATPEAMVTLRKLPLWDNFQKWENLVNIGLMLASDVSTCDPVENSVITAIVKKCSEIYN